MSYRVEYDTKTKREQVQTSSGTRRLGIWCLCFAIFLILVNFFWAEGKELLFQLILPGDAHVTWNAMQQFSDNLSGGIPLQFAVREFCDEILRSCY